MHWGFQLEIELMRWVYGTIRSETPSHTSQSVAHTAGFLYLLGNSERGHTLLWWTTPLRPVSVTDAIVCQRRIWRLGSTRSAGSFSSVEINGLSVAPLSLKKCLWLRPREGWRKLPLAGKCAAYGLSDASLGWKGVKAAVSFCSDSYCLLRNINSNIFI